MINLCIQSDCTGCGACYNSCPKHAISMIEDTYGFIIPQINHNICIECHQCVKSCPVLNPISKHNAVQHPIAAISKDKKTLIKSSSGGIFSLLAQWILDLGGVVYGVVMDEQFNVFHQEATTINAISPMRGSKYVQSNTKETFNAVKKHLKEGKKVLYSGTPCQIAGLRQFLHNVNMENLYCIDIVCHGVPANKMFKTYIRKLAQRKHYHIKDIKDPKFRNYLKWDSGYNFFYTIDYRENICHNVDNLYLSLFLKSYIYRESCYHCTYATPERVGDITIADFWGIGTRTPFLHNVENGCSLILPNTKKGEVLFKAISPMIEYELRDWDEAFKVNHQLYKSTKKPAKRDLAIKLLYHRPLLYTYIRIYMTPRFILRIIKNKIKKL